MSRLYVKGFFVFVLFSLVLLYLPVSSVHGATDTWMSAVANVSHCGNEVQELFRVHDGDTATYMNHNVDVTTHWFCEDLGGVYNVSSVRWWCSNNGASGMDFIASCDIYGSVDLSSWTLVGEDLEFSDANQYVVRNLTSGMYRFFNVTNIDSENADNYYACFEIGFYVGDYISDGKSWMYFGSVEDKCGESLPVANYIDGNVTVGDYWSCTTNHGHWVVVDLGSTYYVDIFHNHWVADGSSYTQADVNIYGSLVPEPDSWGSPINVHNDIYMTYITNDYNWTIIPETLVRYLNITYPDPADAGNVLRVYDAWFYGVEYIPFLSEWLVHRGLFFGGFTVFSVPLLFVFYKRESIRAEMVIRCLFASLFGLAFIIASVY